MNDDLNRIEQHQYMNSDKDVKLDNVVKELWEKFSTEDIYSLGCKMIAKAMEDCNKAISDSQIEILMDSLESENIWREFELDQVRSSGILKVPECEICSKTFESPARDAYYYYDSMKKRVIVCCEGCYQKRDS